MQTLFGLLPALALGLTWVAIRGRYPNRGTRETFLWAVVAVGWGALVGAELLSLLHLLNPAGAFALWGGWVGLVLIWVRRELRAQLAGLAACVRGLWAAASRLERGLLVALLLLVLSVLALALVSPPTNFDSQTYHLSRVRYWMQQASLAHFASHDLRYVSLAPAAEVFILHTYLLSGADLWAQAVQWLSWVSSALVVTLIAQQLGVGRTGQLLSAALVLTAPPLLLQASSTQNDLVVALWIGVALWAALEYAQQSAEEPARGWLWLTAAALGLGLATKGTALFWGAPVGLYLAGTWLRRHATQRQGWGELAVAASLLLTPVAGFMGRNWALLGSPLGVPFGLGVEGIGPGSLLSNFVRNTAMHLQLPGTSSAWLTEVVSSLHTPWGLDVSDPATTLSPPFTIWPLNYYEDYAGAVVWLALLGLAAVAFVWRFRATTEPMRAVGAICALGLLLFCLLLKWQVWGIRLQIPFILITSAWAVAVLLHALPTWGVRIGWAAVAVSVLFAANVLLKNPLKPLARFGDNPPLWALDRMTNRFRSQPIFAEPYRQVVDSLAKRFAGQPAPHIGLRMTIDSWEYPLWVGLDHALPQGYQMHPLAVDSLTQPLWRPARLDVVVELDNHRQIARVVRP